MSRDTAIAIVGGGLAGACMANLLARQHGLPPERIVLIEPRLKEALAPAKEEVDLRVSAISRSTERILAACGVWERLSAGRINPYERMCVWDEGGKAQGPGAIHFDCAELGQPNLGYIVENNAIQAALLEQARQAGVRLLAGQVARLEPRDDALLVGLKDGADIQAGLVIAADGGDSPARQMMGIGTRAASYGQQAIVTHIRTGESHRHTAWQRFLSTGPIALLPLQDGRSSIVWSTSEAAARELMAGSDEEFCRAVEKGTDKVLGAVEACASRAVFPLRRAHAERYVAPRFALVGDAAHTIHPLAGQGVNLGFLDCAALAEVVIEALGQGKDPGEIQVLRRYERWRKGENLLMLAALDGLNSMFSNESNTLGQMRRAGLSLLDRIGPAKTAFMRRALGLSGDLPRLATAAAGQ